MKYAALFCRRDSAYKKREAWDVYDADRDALTFEGGMPVVCHPPCRAWGVMSHMAFRKKDWSGQDTEALEAEKELARWAVREVVQNGGILEHPAGSKLFKEIPLLAEHPEYILEIDQYDFGHVAHKPTKLFIYGVHKFQFPPLPQKRTEPTDRSIAGNVPGTKRCTQYQREYTPEALIDWFEAVLDRIPNKGESPSGS